MSEPSNEPVPVPVESSSQKELTDVQKLFLKTCEETFGNRFTEDDDEYMKLYKKDESIPPILPNWDSRRSSNYRPRNYSNNRHYNNYRNDSRDRGYNNSYDRSRNNSYDRGYNSYNKRSHDYGDRGSKRFYGERE